MAVWFRNADRRWPFLWEGSGQPPARWHGVGEGPAQYLADTPDGAWAEFLRHEEIDDPRDLAGVERNLWAIDVPDGEAAARPALADDLLLGGLDSYPACRAEATRLRAAGPNAIEAPSAALVAGGARGQRTDSGLVDGDDSDGRVLVLYGARPMLRGWLCTDGGRPATRVVGLVRPL